MPTSGNGEYLYDVIEDWGKIPSGWSLGVVTGVAVDSQERVYICQQQQDPPVMVFDRDGNYLRSWGTGFIKEPHTIYIGPDDVLYLADRGDHVALKLTLDGQLLLELGNRGTPSDTGCTEDEGVVLRAAGPFNRPTRMAPSPSGDLYVSDGYRNSRVHRFSADGDFVASWGESGNDAPGHFYSLHSLWIDQDGLIYVCDRKNNRVQTFSMTGQFMGQWPDVSLPTDLHIDHSGTIYLAERQGDGTLATWISVRDPAGNVLARWDTPRSHQIWVDLHGDIYLVSGLLGSPENGVATKYVRMH